jgi:hypothetical protein
MRRVDRAPGFAVPLRRAMRRAGLRGSTAEVRLQGDELVLTGDAGGMILIPAREVDRIRIASIRLPPPRHSVRPPATLYDTKIWRSGERRPLLIGPPLDHPTRYGPVMREFAGWVFAAGGEILRGPGLFALTVEMVWTVGSVTVVGLLLLGGAIVEDRLWLWIVSAIVLALPFFLARRIYRRHWPRRVSRPEELDEVLPPREESR